jgi:predicted Ser/Thr protein kinase
MAQKFLARGKRGIVFLEEQDGEKICVKKPNPKSTAIYRLENEARFLQKLNAYGVGPKFISIKENELRMEFVDGERILKYFENNDKDKIKKIILLVFGQLRIMDELHINKKEMTNPYKHIIIRSHRPIMIDFERCSYSNKPSNITQFCQFLVREKTRMILEEKGVIFGKQKILELAKIYKNEPSGRNFHEIRKVFTLER